MFMERWSSEDVQGMWLAKRYTREGELGLGPGLERTLILTPNLTLILTNPYSDPNPNHPCQVDPLAMTVDSITGFS